MRQITPVVNGVHSYAVAWASKRDDGNPYEYRTKMSDFGLTHKNGYVVTVSSRTFLIIHIFLSLMLFQCYFHIGFVQ